MSFGKAIVHEYPCHQNCVLKSQRKLIKEPHSIRLNSKNAVLNLTYKARGGRFVEHVVQVFTAPSCQSIQTLQQKPPQFIQREIEQSQMPNPILDEDIYCSSFIFILQAVMLQRALTNYAL